MRHRFGSSQRPDGRTVAWLLAFLLGALDVPTSLAQELQPIPKHPSRLSFPERSVRVPRAEPLTHRLSNGTPVVVVEDASLPLVDVVVALRAGSFLDPAGKAGLAELTGAMVRRGGTSSHDADAFDEAIDALGAEIDTRATGTRAGASLDCLAETFEGSLGLFFEMLRRPAFQDDRLAGIKGNLMASFAARNDDPISVMEREWSWLLVGERHYLGRQLDRDRLEALESGDLASFHARYWRPEHAVIAVSGDVETQRVLELLEDHVRRWTEALPPREGGDDSPWPPTGPEPGARPGIYFVEHPTPQAKVSMGQMFAPITDWLSKEALALEVANEILGGTSGLVSRINGRLRGQGWVYRALSELDAGHYEPGSFRIFLDASPDNVLRALSVCLEEIERLRGTPVHPRELSIVKEELLSALALRFDSAEGVAGYFAEDLLMGRPHEYWYGYVERVKALKLRDIQRAARDQIDPAALRVLIVGGGAGVVTGGSPHRLLAGWLGNVTSLPRRDPATLLPLRSGSAPTDPG